MSTSQRVVMLCGWGAKAGMACLQVKLCVAIPERFRIWYIKALGKCPGLLSLLTIVAEYRPSSVVCLSVGRSACLSH